MNVVTDIETLAGLNPKVARMEPVAEAIRAALANAGVPVLNVRASDNICSAVDIAGSFDARESRKITPSRS